METPSHDPMLLLFNHTPCMPAGTLPSPLLVGITIGNDPQSERGHAGETEFNVGEKPPTPLVTIEISLE